MTFRHGKKPSYAIITFESALERNLLGLCSDLSTGAYIHGTYTHKIVNEKKRRDIYVATVRDRLVHRLLYDHLVPIIDPRLDYDVWSCRRGKGLHGGLERTSSLLKRHPTAWVWRGDVQKFFDTVNHALLWEMLKRHIDNTTVLDLLHEVIGSYSAAYARGIPIGNLTSQLFANVYLHEFDSFVRHYLKPLAYIRYGDDFIMFVPSEMQAVEHQQRAQEFLKNTLKLQLHSRNNVLIKARQGLHFLGHTVYGSGYTLSNSTYRRVLDRLSAENSASYNGMSLTAAQRKTIQWRLLQQGS